jgi:group I intron endonuclease
MAKVSISFKGVACIYAVLSPTGKIYIGQTWDLYHRYKSGVSKNQRLLYRSYTKHGEEAHKLFTLLEFKGAVTQAELDTWECFYIEDYKAKGHQLLNIREGGGNNGRMARESKAIIGVKSKEYHKQNPEWSKSNIKKLIENNKGSKRLPESKKAISDALKAHIRTEAHCENISIAKKGKQSSFKGKTFSEESKKKLSASMQGKGSVPVCQFDINGIFIKEWPSIKIAAETLKLPTGTIGGCVRKVKHYKTCGGFIWRYKSDTSPIISNDHKQIYNPKQCSVIQLDLNGNVITVFESVKTASEITGTNRTNLIKCCRGTRNSAGGFTWRYK